MKEYEKLACNYVESLDKHVEYDRYDSERAYKVGFLKCHEMTLEILEQLQFSGTNVQSKIFSSPHALREALKVFLSQIKEKEI